MIWSVFNHFWTQTLSRKTNVAVGCSKYKKLLKTLKLAQKLVLPSTIYLCLLSNASPREVCRGQELTISACHLVSCNADTAGCPGSLHTEPYTLPLVEGA